jgi:hypothetical protein
MISRLTPSGEKNGLRIFLRFVAEKNQFNSGLAVKKWSKSKNQKTMGNTKTRESASESILDRAPFSSPQSLHFSEKQS